MGKGEGSLKKKIVFLVLFILASQLRDGLYAPVEQK